MMELHGDDNCPYIETNRINDLLNDIMGTIFCQKKCFRIIKQLLEHNSGFCNTVKIVITKYCVKVYFSYILMRGGYAPLEKM